MGAAKRLFFRLAYRFGVTRFAAWWNRNRVMVLCYHGVTERSDRRPDDSCGLHVRRDRFERQLDYLLRYYRIISLDDYLRARRENRPLPPYSVILTFDDGYRNFLTAAAPCLAERRIPAALFLITDQIDRRDDPDSDRKWSPIDEEVFLSWAEVKALKQEQEIEIGSHTCSHPELPSIPPEEAKRELSDSHAAIAAHLKNDTMALAYPKGKYSKCIVDLARTLGYRCALTTDKGLNDEATDLFTLRRTLIGDDDDEPAFAARLSGLTAWVRRT